METNFILLVENAIYQRINNLYVSNELDFDFLDFITKVLCHNFSKSFANQYLNTENKMSSLTNCTGMSDSYFL